MCPCELLISRSGCLSLSGTCDSLQQDGQDHCFLLHSVPALLGLLGRFAFSAAWPPPVHLQLQRNRTHLSPVIIFRCCIRPLGARALAETAQLSVRKSECASCSWFRSSSHNAADKCEILFDPYECFAVSLRYADHLHRFHENDPNL